MVIGEVVSIGKDELVFAPERVLLVCDRVLSSLTITDYETNQVELLNDGDAAVALRKTLPSTIAVKLMLLLSEEKGS